MNPVISHLACELDQQRRLNEASREARIRAARPRGWRRRRPAVDFAADLRPHGEDVWRAFRF